MEPTLNQYTLAIEKATIHQIEALSEIDNLQNQQSAEYAFFTAFDLSTKDIDIIAEWLKYTTLGLVSINGALDTILINSESEESAILAYFSNFLTNYPDELKNQILTFEINQNLDTELPLFKESFINASDVNKSKSTAGILSALATPNIGDNTNQNTFTKDDILAGIENPAETVKTPSFALPKSKPQTTSILSSLAKPADPVKSIDQDMIQSGEDTDIAIGAIIDPFMKSIGNSVQTPNQIHTSENEKRASTADILSQATTSKEQNTPAQDILETMNTKLQQVQGTTPTETYKVADAPRHDPYREIPSM